MSSGPACCSRMLLAWPCSCSGGFYGVNGCRQQLSPPLCLVCSSLLQTVPVGRAELVSGCQGRHTKMMEVGEWRLCGAVDRERGSDYPTKRQLGAPLRTLQPWALSDSAWGWVGRGAKSWGGVALRGGWGCQLTCDIRDGGAEPQIPKPQGWTG